MEPLATTDDLEAVLGRTLTDTEAARVEALLVQASAVVRRRSTQDFTQAETIIRLHIRDGFAVLPQRPVNDVSTVQTIDGNDVWYQWDGLDRIIVDPSRAINDFELNTLAYPPPTIDVTYDHGYAPTDDDPPASTIPADVVALVCQVVLRTLGQDPTAAGMQQESIAGYSYSVGSAAAAGVVGLLPAEAEFLDTFRRRGATGRIGP